MRRRWLMENCIWFWKWPRIWSR